MNDNMEIDSTKSEINMEINTYCDDEEEDDDEDSIEDINDEILLKQEIKLTSSQSIGLDLTDENIKLQKSTSPVKSSSNAKPITTIQQDIDNKCNLLKFPLIYKSISMTKADLYDLSTNTLRLNDEKMNYIGSLITDLYSPSSIYFSTQFYTLLVVKQIYNFEKVKNWHENRDFKVADKLIIPIHLKFEFHWILVVVDLKLKEIIYYDSAFNEKKFKRISNYNR